MIKNGKGGRSMPAPVAAALAARTRATPHVYRPQPVPHVLQRKVVTPRGPVTKTMIQTKTIGGGIIQRMERKRPATDPPPPPQQQRSRTSYAPATAAPQWQPPLPPQPPPPLPATQEWQPPLPPQPPPPPPAPTQVQPPPAPPPLVKPPPAPPPQLQPPPAPQQAEQAGPLAGLESAILNALNSKQPNSHMAESQTHANVKTRTPNAKGIHTVLNINRRTGVARTIYEFLRGIERIQTIASNGAGEYKRPQEFTIGFENGYDGWVSHKQGVGWGNMQETAIRGCAIKDLTVNKSHGQWYVKFHFVPLHRD